MDKSINKKKVKGMQQCKLAGANEKEIVEEMMKDAITRLMMMKITALINTWQDLKKCLEVRS